MKSIGTILTALFAALVGQAAQGEGAAMPKTLTLSAGPALLSGPDAAGAAQLEFVNDCYAEAGAAALLLTPDAGPPALVLSQAVPVEGCPEIFSPVARTTSFGNGTVPPDVELFARGPATAATPSAHPVAPLSFRRLALPSLVEGGGALRLAAGCDVGEVISGALSGSFAADGLPRRFLAVAEECVGDEVTVSVAAVAEAGRLLNPIR